MSVLPCSLISDDLRKRLVDRAEPGFDMVKINLGTAHVTDCDVYMRMSALCIAV